MVVDRFDRHWVGYGCSVFSLTYLEPHSAAGLIPTNLTSFALETATLVVLWVTHCIEHGIFLTNPSVCASRVSNKFG